MKIVTWNLAQRSPTGSAGTTQLAALEALKADLLLLTEVRHDVPLLAAPVRSPPPRFTGRAPMTWCAIWSRHDLTPIASQHEALALAFAPERNLVVACSVLPWRGAGQHWPGDPTAPLAERFHESLTLQVAEIDQALKTHPGAKLVWGGDFNQTLHGKQAVGTRTGEALLTATLTKHQLIAATRECASLTPGCASIDHVLVPADWRVQVQRCTPQTPEGTDASDHALYVVTRLACSSRRQSALT